jgi:hypothetical protein
MMQGTYLDALMTVPRRFRNWLSKFITGTIALLVVWGACHGGTVDPLDDKNAASNAMLTWFDVGAPLNHMLLIRRGEDACVVRFTAFQRGHDAKPSTAFNSGEESFSAEYDWFDPTTSAAGPGRPAYDTGHRSVSRRASAGIGRLAFAQGDSEIRCGHFRLAWFYPVRVGFNSKNSAKNIGIELAPTKWTKIEDVSFSNPAIRWYIADEARKPMLIPVDDLPPL